ncbi:MAG: thiol peroxidase [Gammaproteobacteria bacterium]
MSQVMLKGNPVSVAGALPEIGGRAPELRLTTTDLRDVGLNEWSGKRKLLSIFPSIDTGVCAMSTKKFNDQARDNEEIVMLMISGDLPFAHQRFCGNEGLENVVNLSTMRNQNFARDYGVYMEDGPLAGLTARAIVVLDEHNTVVHTELVEEISSEPNYVAALRAIGIEASPADT